MNLFSHHTPTTISDHVALTICKILRAWADIFFKKRYGHRAVVLETVAAIPGIIGGMISHLRCLFFYTADDGRIKDLLCEAQNERMHLMTFIEIAKPTKLERLITWGAQVLFFFMFLLLYLISKKTAHRLIGYFEEEAIISYSEYINEIERNPELNIPAPDIAKKYWNLPDDAKIKEVLVAIRMDEVQHKEINHRLANL